MADFGRIFFMNARESGIAPIAQLGSGTFDHLGFFGSQGPTTAIEIGSWQDTTVIVDSNGDPAAGMPFGGSGYCTNTKNIGASTVRISGQPVGPFEEEIDQVNIFEVGNLDTEPFFNRIPSGTLLVKYEASGTSAVHTFNAKMFAYDNTGAITDPPPDVTMMGFEINASGQWANSSHSGVWKSMQGSNDALLFSDHSNANGWQARNVHLWVAALTGKAEAVGALDQWDLAFSVQFN